MLDYINGAKQLPTQDQARRQAVKSVNPPVQAARVQTHYRHLLLLLSPIAE